MIAYYTVLFSLQSLNILIPSLGLPGFCEYYDVDTAASAVRNLNGVAEVRGRLLRVDFAQPDIKDMPKDQRGARDKFGLPPLPPGVILPPGVNPADQVHNKLSNIQPGQLLDIIHQVKVSRGRRRCVFTLRLLLLLRRPYADFAFLPSSSRALSYRPQNKLELC